MKSILEILEGKTVATVTDEVSSLFSQVTESQSIEVPIQLTFDDYILNIYNPLTVQVNGNTSNVASLRGLVVERIIESKDSINLKFSEGYTLIIDIRANQYNGPEALTLQGPHNLYVVWD